MDLQHLDTQTPVDYHNYQAVSIHLDGNSDNFHSLNNCQLFLQ